MEIGMKFKSLQERKEILNKFSKKWLSESNIDVLKTKEWLDKMGIENYAINKDGTVDVNGRVFLRGVSIPSFPIQFGRVIGYFKCVDCGLTSLVGAPKEVYGSFDCSNNQINSLDGCPKVLQYSFNISGNPIAKEMSPMEIRKYFKQNEIKLNPALNANPATAAARFEIYTDKTNKGLSTKDVGSIRKERGALERIKNKREQIKSTAKEIDDIYADTYGDQERYSYETYGESKSTDLSKKQAWQMDRNSAGQINVDIEWDDDLNAYGVFGVPSGFCYYYAFDEDVVTQWVEENPSSYNLVYFPKQWRFNK